MAQFRDEWLTNTLAQLIGEDELEELKQGDDVASSLWETAIVRKVATDSQILSTLATKFRVKIADLEQIEAAAKGVVTEAQARKYHILPVRATDSYLEIATANPFDIDCEKTLAFATGREVRLLLASPVIIGERLDESAGVLANHWDQADRPAEAAVWHANAARWTGVQDLRAANQHWSRAWELAKLPQVDNPRLAIEACTNLLASGWRIGTPPKTGLVKQHNLQGPIDDAFMERSKIGRRYIDRIQSILPKEQFEKISPKRPSFLRKLEKLQKSGDS
ncbi:MAG: hypothetical protein IH798_04230 [Gemmatimonadetes bacterium]|nr:hypothetical protein [Gemmatimonadota bacterium]